ncbi:MAG: type II toxin-antitoxin system VapC family toxin [Planctomycetia bacterium]
MKLLIDTHVLLWWFEDPARISEAARDRISDPENEVLVSAVSCWEIAIKRGLGKLTAPEGVEEVIAQCGFAELAISISHSLKTETLPFHHRDPFDRMLIAQAFCESAILVSHDRMFEQYGIPLIHA